MPSPLLLALAGLLGASCVTPPRMCASETDCGPQASCIAGRCVAHGATPAIDTARRLVFFPIDEAYVRPDADTHDAAAATLGGARDRGAALYLRFAAPLPPEAHVLEAYLLLERTTDVDGDPIPVVLHAARIVAPWDARSISWARQPRVQEVGAPITRASPTAGPLVRLDVRALVQHWRRRLGEDFGLAVLSDEERGTGMGFALAPVVAPQNDPVLAPVAAPATQAPAPFEPHPASPASAAEPRAELVGPRLEVYVR
jgi:hypothetical protein